MDWVQRHVSPEIENDLAGQYASLGALLMDAKPTTASRPTGQLQARRRSSSGAP